MAWTRKDWFALLFLTFLATVLRFYGLGQIPPGLHFDEAYNGLDAGLILAGDRPLFLPANHGREVAYSYYQAALAALFGLTPYTLRLASALAGIATIPVGYLVLRRMLRRGGRAVPFFALAALATSLWHIHFSHYGIRVITMPLIFSGLFGFFWWGLRTPGDRRAWVAFTLSGLLAGLAVWTHPSGRLSPLVLLAFAAYLVLTRSRRTEANAQPTLRRTLLGLGVTGGVSFLVFLPLGLHFLENPHFFFSHVYTVSVFNDAGVDMAPWLVILRNSLRVAGMFIVRGAESWTHNFHGRPVFDPILAIPFLVGVFLWLRRVLDRTDEDRDALVFLALWVMVMLSTSVLSDDAPDFSRTTTAQPAVFVSVGLGLAWIMGALNRRRRQLGTTTVTVLLIASSIWSVTDYFVRFPRHVEEYYTLYSVDKIDAIHALVDRAADDDRIYFSQLWGDFAPVRFLGDSYDITSYDIGDALVLPPVGWGALYAFPYEQRDRALRLAELWPGVTAERIRDRFGHGLLMVVQVDAETLRDWPPGLYPDESVSIDFVEGPTLRGTQRDGEALRLYWEADEPMLRDLTLFLHLIDPDGRRVGQGDRRPADGSYATPRWRPGERVIDLYRPGLQDPCAAGAELTVRLGWYEIAAQGLRRPRADGNGDVVELLGMVFPLSDESEKECVEQ